MTPRRHPGAAQQNPGSRRRITGAPVSGSDARAPALRFAATGMALGACLLSGLVVNSANDPLRTSSEPARAEL